MTCDAACCGIRSDDDNDDDGDDSDWRQSVEDKGYFC